MQLCVGPVALVSLLTGQLINQYNIDYVNNPEEAVAFAGEAALAVGVILVGLSISKLGNMIQFVSHPVMSGFTTGAAALIGLNQLKSAFGFTLTVPQQGQPGYEYNYQVMQWFNEHWNLRYHFTPAQIAKKASLGLQDGRLYRNPVATKIFFGLYIPLLIIVILKNYFKPTPQRKKSMAYHIWQLTANIMPFIAIIIGAHLAWEVKHGDHYNSKAKGVTHNFYANKLSIVGKVKPGLGFIQTPSFKWKFGTVLGSVIEVALIAYMESWGVAQRIAKQNNEFHLLNANQELWSIGIANMLSSCSSAYPVAGSFSRSSLNQLAGAKTPLSKGVNMIVIILALGALTSTFQYIPNAALAAIIWVAVYQLISISEFWEAWKHSKKDFFVMFVTFIFVFVLNTGIGLAVGISASVLVYLVDTAFNPANAPIVLETEELKANNVKHIRLKSDLNFITTQRTADIVHSFVYLAPTAPDAVDSTWNDRVFYKITKAFDDFFQPGLLHGVHSLPVAVVIDLELVNVIDLDGIMAVSDWAKSARSKKVAFAVINANPVIAKSLAKFEFASDDLADLVDPKLHQKFLDQSGDIIPIKAKASGKLIEGDKFDEDNHPSSKTLIVHGNEEDKNDELEA
jgi:MFS superfamily sulfate permease-like transporter